LYGNFGIILVELKKIGTLWEQIAKIETLVFELKNVNFWGVHCYFPLLCDILRFFAYGFVNFEENQNFQTAMHIMLNCVLIACEKHHINTWIT
jgi:hypothetical protein